MKGFVVDASLAVKWLVPEVDSTAAARLLRLDVELLAPDLIWAEVGNVLWRKWRLGELAVDEVGEILAEFRRLPLQTRAIEPLYESAWTVAHTLERSFYDSLYIAVAMETGYPLVTADMRLYNAVQGTPWSRHCIKVGEIG